MISNAHAIGDTQLNALYRLRIRRDPDAHVSRVCHAHCQHEPHHQRPLTRGELLSLPLYRLTVLFPYGSAHHHDRQQRHRRQQQQQPD